MKKFVFIILQLWFAIGAYGQSTESIVHLNSGLFSFGGDLAVKSSPVLQFSDETIQSGYPYGKNMSASYGLSGRIQHITNHKNIFGVELGYELLRSRVNIAYLASDLTGYNNEVSGYSTTKHGFINLFPNLGRRVSIKNFDFDITIGPDIAINTHSREKGKVNLKSTNRTLIIDRKLKNQKIDFRLRSNLHAYYANFGISMGYSYGLHKYVGNNNGAFARFIRFGFLYRINSK